MRKIGIYPAVPGAGGKFVAAALACYLAAAEGKDPAILELGEPGLYDRLGMDQRFAGRPFYPAGGPPNRAAGVNWQLQLAAPDAAAATGQKAAGAAGASSKTPAPSAAAATGQKAAGAAGASSKTPAPSAAAATGQKAAGAEGLYIRLRTLDRVEGDVLLCLLSGLPEEELPLFFREMDRVLCVIDPLPSMLLRSSDRLQMLAELHPAPLWVVNKMNSGVKKGELQAFLGQKSLLQIPCLPPEDIYRAEYLCRCPYEFPAAARKLRPALARLWHELSLPL